MLNRVVLMGRITAEPELKTTNSGMSVVSFNIAVDRNYYKQGEDKQSDFISVVAWRNTAEFICKYVAKGQLIALEGSLQTRTYQDRDGNNRTVTEVLADNVFFTGDKREKNNTQATPEPQPANYEQNDFEELPDNDDLPF